MDAKTLCLGVLMLGDATGYDIRKRVENTFGHFLEVSLASIYPALAALDGAGLVTCVRVSQDDRPDKKIYSLTESGRTEFLKTLMVLPTRHKVRSEFLTLAFFAEILPAWRIRQVIDEGLANFTNFLAQIEAWVAKNGETCGPGARFTAGYGQAVLKAAIEYVKENGDKLAEEAAADSSGAGAAPAPRMAEGIAK